MLLRASIADLIAAGEIAEIVRVGYEPFDDDDVIEIGFANGARFNIDIGLQHATDIEIYHGTCLERAYGHLRSEEPDAFANIARDWASEPIEAAAWAIGEKLSNPRRLAMTQPYRVEVGYAFDCGARVLALFGEADLLHAAALDDSELENFGLASSAI